MNMNLLYIGACRENLETYYPDYIKGIFIDGGVTHETLVAVIKEHGINVLMVDVLDFFFTEIECLCSSHKFNTKYSIRIVEYLIVL